MAPMTAPAVSATTVTSPSTSPSLCAAEFCCVALADGTEEPAELPRDAAEEVETAVRATLAADALDDAAATLEAEADTLTWEAETTEADETAS